MKTIMHRMVTGSLLAICLAFGLGTIANAGQPHTPPPPKKPEPPVVVIHQPPPPGPAHPAPQHPPQPIHPGPGPGPSVQMPPPHGGPGAGMMPIYDGSSYYHDGRGNFYHRERNGSYSRTGNTTAYTILEKRNLLHLMPKETRDLVREHYRSRSGKRVPW